MAEHIGRALEIVGGLVKARVAERENGVRCGDEKKKDLLDVLLEFEGNGVDEPRKLSFDTINKVIVGPGDVARAGRFWPERFGEGGGGGCGGVQGPPPRVHPLRLRPPHVPRHPLVSRLLPRVLAALLLAFDWDLPPPPPPARADVDMGERMGISLRKAVALVAVPVPRRGT
uniref:Uncharacterized protein n=1 Tax=Ananas comosus var. bracteatus TaxID=296719 RepID=A0A6V7PZB7_ANACO|nr:unnamed protein product [Ananas comosus var. bracteatus]